MSYALNRIAAAVAAASSLFAASAVSAGNAPSFRIVDLTTLTAGTTFDQVHFLGLNDFGDLAGYGRRLIVGGTHFDTAIVRYGQGSVRDIGALDDIFYGESIASQINNKGQVFGQGQWPADGAYGSGKAGFALWSPDSTGLVNIGAHQRAGDTYIVSANDQSEIVGSAVSLSFYWSLASGTHELPAGSHGSATDINNHGQIVGNLTDPNLGPLGSFVWSSSTGYKILPRFDSNGATSPSLAFSINDDGVIVGSQYLNGNTIHYMWSETAGLANLGRLPQADMNFIGGGPLDVNNNNYVIGQDRDSGGKGLGYLWTPGSGMNLLQDLVDPSDPLASSTTVYGGQKINNGNVILADAMVDGRVGSILLIPVSQVPETSTSAMLALGIAMLALVALSRRSS